MLNKLQRLAIALPVIQLSSSSEANVHLKKYVCDPESMKIMLESSLAITNADIADTVVSILK